MTLRKGVEEFGDTGDRDRVRGTKVLRQQADPQFLERPAHSLHLRPNPFEPTHYLHTLMEARLEILRRIQIVARPQREPSRGRFQIERHAAHLLGSGVADETRIDEPRKLDANILSLIHISEPTRQAEISYAVFCLK